MFVLTPLFFNAQTNRNAVIGRYIVTSKRLNGSLAVTGVCNILGKMDILISNYCNECISEKDSTDCNLSYPTDWQNYTFCTPIKVFADSTLLDTAGFDPPYFGIGKLHYNDSIYFRYKWCTTSEHQELTGFKLYNTTANFNELSLPENALLISPNPASEVMYIQSTQQNFISITPVLYDIKGAKVNTEIDYINSHTYKVAVSNLPNGIYFVFVYTNSGYLKKKVMVSR
jgi:hypothetical protein